MSDFWVDLKKGDSPITLWDKLTLGGITFPGKCLIQTGVSLEFEMNKILAKAAQGQNAPEFKIAWVDKGYKPGTVLATIEVWDVDQWEDLKETLPKFSPRSGTRQGSARGGTIDETGFVVNPKAKRLPVTGRDAFDISHPACALLGIYQVQVNDIQIPPIVDQTLTVLMALQQYFPNRTLSVPLHNDGGSISGGGLAPPNAAKNLK